MGWPILSNKKQTTSPRENKSYANKIDLIKADKCASKRK